MADIFDEVDEDLKRDQMQVLWARYGKYLIIVVSVVVLGVAARQGYDAWHANKAETSATLYHQALKQDDIIAAMERATDDLSQGYVMLAKFRTAAGFAAKQDFQAAEAAYLSLSENQDISSLYRQAALLLSVMNAPDSRDAKILNDRIAGLEGAAGPWQAIALELAAGLALRSGDRATALAKYEALVGLADIPPSMRQRASQMTQVLKG